MNASLSGTVARLRFTKDFELKRTRLRESNSEKTWEFRDSVQGLDSGRLRPASLHIGNSVNHGTASIAEHLRPFGDNCPIEGTAATIHSHRGAWQQRSRPWHGAAEPPAAPAGRGRRAQTLRKSRFFHSSDTIASGKGCVYAIPSLSPEAHPRAAVEGCGKAPRPGKSRQSLRNPSQARLGPTGGRKRKARPEPGSTPRQASPRGALPLGGREDSEASPEP